MGRHHQLSFPRARRVAGARWRKNSAESSANRSRLRPERSGPPYSARWMTGLTLALEGSTYAGSVAVIRDSEVIADVTLEDVEGSVAAAGRGDRVMPAVAECMNRSGATGHDLARIVCGAGPGRFTSLRVAGALAKGLATGYGVELYAVSSLLLIVAAADPPLG